jgi:hypothetical protein
MSELLVSRPMDKTKLVADIVASFFVFFAL